jgi:hypothetical protein
VPAPIANDLIVFSQAVTAKRADRREKEVDYIKRKLTQRREHHTR